MKAAAAPRIPTVHKIIFVNFATSTRSCRVPLLELLEGTCAPASETAPPAAAATDDARLALATIRSIGRRAKFKSETAKPSHSEFPMTAGCRGGQRPEITLPY